MKKYAAVTVLCSVLLLAATPGARPATAGGLPAPAEAAASARAARGGTACASNPANRHAGYSLLAAGNHASEGTTGFIEVRRAHLCKTVDYPYNFTTTWTMVHPSGGGAYAQSGFMYREWNAGSSTCLGHFSEYSPGPNGWAFKRYFLNDFGWPDCQVQDGEVHRYWQIYNPTLRRMEMWVDDFLFGYTSYDPKKTSAWSTPWMSSVSAETYYADDDIPGVLGWGAFVTQIAVASSATHVWTSPACPAAWYFEADWRYHAWMSADCKVMATWTDPL